MIDEESATIKLDASALLELPGLELVVMEGPDRGLKARLQQGLARIGTAPTSELRLSDATVSRFHCEVSSRSGVPLIRDRGSTTGTFVDGVRIREAYLMGAAMVGRRPRGRRGRCQLEPALRLLLANAHARPLRILTIMAAFAGSELAWHQGKEAVHTAYPQYAREAGTAAAQLDFVVFVDAREDLAEAFVSSEEAFRASARRTKWDIAQE